jgi:hypothetical protein
MVFDIPDLPSSGAAPFPPRQGWRSFRLVW